MSVLRVVAQNSCMHYERLDCIYTIGIAGEIEKVPVCPTMKKIHRFIVFFRCVSPEAIHATI